MNSLAVWGSNTRTIAKIAGTAAVTLGLVDDAGHAQEIIGAGVTLAAWVWSVKEKLSRN